MDQDTQNALGITASLCPALDSPHPPYLITPIPPKSSVSKDLAPEYEEHDATESEEPDGSPEVILEEAGNIGINPNVK